GVRGRRGPEGGRGGGAGGGGEAGGARGGREGSRPGRRRGSEGRTGGPGEGSQGRGQVLHRRPRLCRRGGPCGGRARQAARGRQAGQDREERIVHASGRLDRGNGARKGVEQWRALSAFVMIIVVGLGNPGRRYAGPPP